MSFRFQNLKIGVNENGCHFQDPETGFIFSLLNVSYSKIDIAICRESFKEGQDYTPIIEKIRKLISETGLKPPKKFADIPKENTYISECKKFKFFYDGIGIKHVETQKCIGLEKGTDIPIFSFFYSNYYGYEKCLKDLFELCAPSITKIQAGPDYFKIPIKIGDSEHKIKIFMMNAFVKYIEENAERWVAEVTYEVTDEVILIKKFLFNEGEIVKQNNGKAFFYCKNKELLNVKTLVYIIEAIKRFPQISSLKCKYLKDGKWEKLIITPLNVQRILKSAVYKEIIDLTI